MTVAPHSPKSRATVDLPEAMFPVRPTILVMRALAPCGLASSAVAGSWPGGRPLWSPVETGRQPSTLERATGQLLHRLLANLIRGKFDQGKCIPRFDLANPVRRN